MLEFQANAGYVNKQKTKSVSITKNSKRILFPFRREESVSCSFGLRNLLLLQINCSLVHFKSLSVVILLQAVKHLRHLKLTFLSEVCYILDGHHHSNQLSFCLIKVIQKNGHHFKNCGQKHLNRSRNDAFLQMCLGVTM